MKDEGCFNGAAVFQPRKFSWECKRRNQRGRGFNGAAVFQPRKCAVRALDSAAAWHFNGAAVFQPRKYHFPLPCCVIPAPASMGPRSFNRGNAKYPTKPSRPRCGFNGAAVFQPRKCDALYDDDAIYDIRLQWGRGLSTAEIQGAAIPANGPGPASMGPRSFNRGNALGLRQLGMAEGASMGPRSFNRGNG